MYIRVKSFTEIAVNKYFKATFIEDSIPMHATYLSRPINMNLKWGRHSGQDLKTGVAQLYFCLISSKIVIGISLPMSLLYHFYANKSSIQFIS